MRSALLLFLLATLPSSPNPISAGNVQTEYGGAAPISFSEYYRGGAYVVSGANTSIPTAGAISLHNFHGTTKPSGALSASMSGDALGDCVITCSVSTNEVTCIAAGGTPPYSYAWTKVSGTTMSNYQGSGGASTRYWSGSSTIVATRTAVYRCTVTDSVLATATADVNVSLTFSP